MSDLDITSLLNSTDPLVQKLIKFSVELQQENVYLKSELAQIKKMLFGKKSERLVLSDNGQLKFSFEDQEPLQEEVEKEEQEVITYNRKKPAKEKKQPIRLLLPAHLSRVQEVLEPEEDVTGKKMIGKVITEILEYIPGTFYVHQIIRPKYVMGENENIETSIAIAKLPNLIIPKGNAGASLLAYIIISKFIDHLPFYRLVAKFKRESQLDIAESTINGWFSTTCQKLKPLYEKLISIISSSDYLMADETPIPVLTKDKPGATHKGYQWAYYSPILNAVCYDYQEGRGQEGPKIFLKNFKGSIQSDGYAVYDMFENSHTLLACMAHARRKFFDAQSNDKKRALFALSKIQELYAIESHLRELAIEDMPSYFEKRKALRQEKAKPILVELKAWLDSNLLQVFPKSAIGMAIAYTLRLWPRLIRYIDDGKYEIDNNLVENKIRPLTLGRKNYLFAGSHESAQRAAMIYSLLNTCKAHNIDSLKWLTHVLTLIPDYPQENIEQLLPFNCKL